MYIVSVFLFAAAANLDSFVVGLSYGVRRVHIQFRANLLIAGIVMLGTFLSMVLGAGLKGRRRGGGAGGKTPVYGPAGDRRAGLCADGQ